ncbi:MAG TPA: hypothetical protein VFW77_01490 [Candidatus Saccharimonadales bacterium]|nr:hypothetical protein [Candidatus Saccharimonadales bacterium]
MGIELSAEALRAQTELADAQSGAADARSGLDRVETRLKAVDAQIAGIQGRHQGEIGSLEEAKLRDVLGIYDSRLQNVIALSLGNEDMQLPENPDLEACQRIAELDASIKGSAGQPVTVINTNKDWVDFALLQEPDPEFRIETKGLVIARGPNVHSKHRIELPTYGALAIDPDKGTSPAIDGNRELYAREHRLDGISNPIVDPLVTKAVMPGENAEDYQDEDSETTLVLIGYSHLRGVLNDILGFAVDASASGEDSDSDTSRSFRRADLMVKELQKKGVEFDPDFIDGYLLYRISALEKSDNSNGGEIKDGYRKQVLAGLWEKYEQLLEAGWLKR